MSLLDDLHSQVARVRDEEARQNAELKEQEAFYEHHLKQVMRQSHKYFEEIVESLNIISPEIYASYPLNPSGPRSVSFKQTEYFFNSDNSRHPRQIDILAHCMLEQPVEFYVPTRAGASNHSELLQNHQLPHHRKDKLDNRHEICGATFILEGPMKVHIRIFADPTAKSVHILLRNLESEPVKKYRFSPEKITDDLLDRLARMLVREESQLVEVKLDEEFRLELRRKIEEEERVREQELAEAYAEIEAEKQQAEEAKFLYRVKRAVARKSEALLNKLPGVSRGRHHRSTE